MVSKVGAEYSELEDLMTLSPSLCLHCLSNSKSLLRQTDGHLRTRHLEVRAVSNERSIMTASRL